MSLKVSYGYKDIESPVGLLNQLRDKEIIPSSMWLFTSRLIDEIDSIKTELPKVDLAVLTFIEDGNPNDEKYKRIIKYLKDSVYHQYLPDEYKLYVEKDNSIVISLYGIFPYVQNYYPQIEWNKSFLNIIDTLDMISSLVRKTGERTVRFPNGQEIRYNYEIFDNALGIRLKYSELLANDDTLTREEFEELPLSIIKDYYRYTNVGINSHPYELLARYFASLDPWENTVDIPILLISQGNTNLFEIIDGYFKKLKDVIDWIKRQKGFYEAELPYIKDGIKKEGTLFFCIDGKFFQEPVTIEEDDFQRTAKVSISNKIISLYLSNVLKVGKEIYYNDVPVAKKIREITCQMVYGTWKDKLEPYYSPKKVLSTEPSEGFFSVFHYANKCEQVVDEVIKEYQERQTVDWTSNKLFALFVSGCIGHDLNDTIRLSHHVPLLPLVEDARRKYSDDMIAKMLAEELLKHESELEDFAFRNNVKITPWGQKSSDLSLVVLRGLHLETYKPFILVNFDDISPTFPTEQIANRISNIINYLEKMKYRLNDMRNKKLISQRLRDYLDKILQFNQVEYRGKKLFMNYMNNGMVTLIKDAGITDTDLEKEDIDVITKKIMNFFLSL